MYWQYIFKILYQSHTYRHRTALLRRNVKEQQILAGNNIRHTITIVRHRPKATARTNTVRMLFQIHFARLPVRRLTRRQLPLGIKYGRLQKRRLHLQILGHHIQTEQMPVDAFAAHRVLIAELMASARVQKHAHTLGRRALRIARLHGSHPRRRFDGARSHGFGASLAIESRHRCLVGEREFAGIAEVGELQGHLDEGVGGDAALFHEALAELVVHEDAQIDVLDERLGGGVGAFDGRHGDAAVVVEGPRQARWDGRIEFFDALAVALLVVSERREIT